MGSISRTNAADIQAGKGVNSGPVNNELNNIINNGVNDNDTRLVAAEATLAAKGPVIDQNAADIASMKPNVWTGFHYETGSSYTLVAGGDHMIHMTYGSSAAPATVVLPDPAGFTTGETFFIHYRRNLGQAGRYLILDAKKDGGADDTSRYMNDGSTAVCFISEDSGGAKQWDISIGARGRLPGGILKYGTSATITYNLDSQTYYPWETTMVVLDYTNTNAGEINTLVLWSSKAVRGAEFWLRVFSGSIGNEAKVDLHADDGGGNLITMSGANRDYTYLLRADPVEGWKIVLQMDAGTPGTP